MSSYDRNTHPLLSLKMVPESLIQLRKELQLPENKDIHDAAIVGNTFEECLAIIATKLRIVVDGIYEADALCNMLVTQMRLRHKTANIITVESPPFQH